MTKCANRWSSEWKLNDFKVSIMVYVLIWKILPRPFTEVVLCMIFTVLQYNYHLSANLKCLLLCSKNQSVIKYMQTVENCCSKTK